MSTFSCEPDAVFDIVLGDVYPQNETPRTVMQFMRTNVQKNPGHEALRVKRNGEWKAWTYAQYDRDVRLAAKAMIKVGLERFHGVGILGFNAPEWHISDLAAIFAGGFAVGYYTTNSADACVYVATDSNTQVMVVEDDKQLKKILSVRDQLPKLKAIVQYTGTPSVQDSNVYSWEAFLELGQDSSLDAELEARIADQKPGNCCTLIYTSGTTGDPKGVMISHDNLTWTSARVADLLVLDEEHVVSYLPLSHIAAQMLDIIFPLSIGATVWFAQPDALKGSLVETLKEVRPTIFLGVPRVWEKIQEKMKEVGAKNTGIMKTIGDIAKRIGYEGNKSLEEGGSVPWGWWLANTVVFSKIRAALGLDRCKIQITGAAPVSRETVEYFMSLNIPLYDIFGMSESSALATASVPGSWKSNTSGTFIKGIDVKIDNPDAQGEGEIIFRGRNIMMGYLKKPEKTVETFTADGWLKSGDVGHFDSRNFLSITGRIKELLITAGGENVPPVLIENEVKQEIPLLSNCMLIGDKKKFLSILVSLKCEVDEEQNPQDQLTPSAIEIVKSLGSSATTVTEAAKDPAVLKHIEEGIIRRNKYAVSNAQKIQKFKVLPRDFSVGGGELGPTLKLKRPVVTKMYEELIDTMYQTNDE